MTAVAGGLGGVKMKLLGSLFHLFCVQGSEFLNQHVEFSQSAFLSNLTWVVQFLGNFLGELTGKSNSVNLFSGLDAVTVVSDEVREERSLRSLVHAWTWFIVLFAAAGDRRSKGAVVFRAG